MGKRQSAIARRIGGDAVVRDAPLCALLSPGDAASLLPRWDALYHDSAEQNVFHAPWMLWPALQRLAPPQLRIACAFDESGGLIGLLPIAPRATYARLPVAHVETWRHEYAFYAAPLLKRGQEALAMQRLLDAAAQHPSRPAFLRMTQLDEAGPSVRALAPYRERLVYQTDSELRPCWTPSMRDALSAKRAAELRRKRARLTESGAALRAYSGDEALDTWINAFLSLEASGWKGEGGTALVQDASASGWFRECLHAASDRGALRFLRIDTPSGPAAMTIGFVEGGAGYGFKSAFDEDFARCSPGVLLMQDLTRMLERETGLVQFDSCAKLGRSPANGLWTDRRAIASWNISLNGALGSAALGGLRMVEDAARRLRGETGA